jgi:hypothetical protein
LAVGKDDQGVASADHTLAARIAHWITGLTNQTGIRKTITEIDVSRESAVLSLAAAAERLCCFLSFAFTMFTAAFLLPGPAFVLPRFGVYVHNFSCLRYSLQRPITILRLGVPQAVVEYVPQAVAGGLWPV